MIIALVLAVVVLYWAGGQKNLHTAFRDVGCSICIMAIATLLLGWHWTFFIGFLVMWAGLTIGDHGPAFWSLHGLITSLGMLPFAIATGAWLPMILCAVVVTFGTYLVSRFFSNKWGVDVIGRGLLYATIPFWFLINLQN